MEATQAIRAAELELRGKIKEKELLDHEVAALRAKIAELHAQQAREVTLRDLEDATQAKVLEVVQRLFSEAKPRKLQKVAAQRLVVERKDLVCVCPTAMGKTLGFGLPTLLSLLAAETDPSAKRVVTIVISPSVDLIGAQVAKWNLLTGGKFGGRFGIAKAKESSGLVVESESRTAEALVDGELPAPAYTDYVYDPSDPSTDAYKVLNGEIDFWFMTGDMLTCNPEVQYVADALALQSRLHIAVDEADSFINAAYREAMLRSAEVVRAIRASAGRLGGVVVSIWTATADPAAEAELRDLFGILDSATTYRVSANRPEHEYGVVDCAITPVEKESELLASLAIRGVRQVLSHIGFELGRKVMVFQERVRDVLSVAAALEKHFGTRSACISGLGAAGTKCTPAEQAEKAASHKKARKEEVRRFVEDPGCWLCVASSAGNRGLDIPELFGVVHNKIYTSVLEFLQASGRVRGPGLVLQMWHPRLVSIAAKVLDLGARDDTIPYLLSWLGLFSCSDMCSCLRRGLLTALGEDSAHATAANNVKGSCCSQLECFRRGDLRRPPLVRSRYDVTAVARAVVTGLAGQSGASLADGCHGRGAWASWCEAEGLVAPTNVSAVFIQLVLSQHVVLEPRRSKAEGAWRSIACVVSSSVATLRLKRGDAQERVYAALPVAPPPESVEAFSAPPRGSD